MVRELRTASWRSWLALAVIAIGPQAFATVLFTRSLGYAFSPSPAAQSGGVLSEVYLLYLLQPVFGATMAWIVLHERRRALLLAAGRPRPGRYRADRLLQQRRARHASSSSPPRSSSAR